MSLLIPRMGDAAHDERQKRALICAVLSYLLFLIIVVLSFAPQKKTVSITVGVTGKPSLVRWGGSGAGRGRLGRRVRRSKVKLSRRERLAEKNKLKKTVKKPVEKVVAKKVEQHKKIARKTAVSQPPVLEKKPEKMVKKPLKKEKQKPEHKPEKMVAAERVPSVPIVPPALPVPKIPAAPAEQEKKVPKVSPVTPEPVIEQAPEPEPVTELVAEPESITEQEVLEIGVGTEPLSGESCAGDQDGDGEVSRDEYALMCAVGRTWRLPRGLKPGLSARLVVSLSAQGKVERVDIETSSRVPAYDIAARGALYRAEYPSVFWGKNIAVVFG